jgi:hypothetical protein
VDSSARSSSKAKLCSCISDQRQHGVVLRKHGQGARASSFGIDAICASWEGGGV